jgi:hypothetical protein
MSIRVKCSANLPLACKGVGGRKIKDPIWGEARHPTTFDGSRNVSGSLYNFRYSYDLRSHTPWQASFVEPQHHAPRFLARRGVAEENVMPVLLWFGIPVLIAGSGFVLYRIVGG